MRDLDHKKEEDISSEMKKAFRRISEVENLEAQCRLAEDKIKQQNEFLNQVLESLTHPFYVLDANDYTIKLANSAARLGDLSERPTCYGITHRRDAPCEGIEHICPLQQVKRTGKPVSVEHIHYDKDGNARNVEVHAYPIFDAQGNVVRMIEYVLDITERKSLEKEIESYAEKVKLFAYSVSHDLKNPIITIHGLARLLCKYPPHGVSDDKSIARCFHILKASEQALNLIEEINLFIRMKEVPLNLEIISPKEVIREIRNDFLAVIDERRIRWSEPEYIPEMKADKMSLLRVFRNLVDNALKYGGKDLRQIRVGYNKTADFHIFSVYDDGIDIDRQSVKKIFETFQRSEKSGKIEGTGLGLAIVKEIAEKHGGKAWVESGHNRGVVFYISISNSL